MSGITIRAASSKYGVNARVLAAAWRKGAIIGERLGNSANSPVRLDSASVETFAANVPVRSAPFSKFHIEYSSGFPLVVMDDGREGYLEKLGKVYYAVINGKRYNLNQRAVKQCLANAGS